MSKNTSFLFFILVAISVIVLASVHETSSSDFVDYQSAFYAACNSVSIPYWHEPMYGQLARAFGVIAGCGDGTFTLFRSIVPAFLVALFLVTFWILINQGEVGKSDIQNYYMAAFIFIAYLMSFQVLHNFRGGYASAVSCLTFLLLSSNKKFLITLAAFAAGIAFSFHFQSILFLLALMAGKICQLLNLKQGVFVIFSLTILTFFILTFDFFEVKPFNYGVADFLENKWKVYTGEKNFQRKFGIYYLFLALPLIFWPNIKNWNKASEPIQNIAYFSSFISIVYCVVQLLLMCIDAGFLASRLGKPFEAVIPMLFFIMMSELKISGKFISRLSLAICLMSPAIGLKIYTLIIVP